MPEAIPGIGAVALHGALANTDEKMCVIAMETPIPVQSPGVPLPLDKTTVERTHLERYRSDYLTNFGELPFDEVSPGANPPDFIVREAAGPVAVDCTSFTLQERRHAYDLFLIVQREIGAEFATGNLDHLNQTQLVVWFGLGDKLPPRHKDNDVIAALVKELRRCTIDRERLKKHALNVAGQGFPEEMPADALAIFWTEDRSAGFQVIPIDASPGPAGQQRALYCGFSMSSQVTESEVRDELYRLIAGHDNSVTDHLLVTIGAPDRNGLRYPAEEQIVRLITDEVLQGVRVQSLKKISIHVWSSGAIRVGTFGKGTNAAS